MSGYPVITYRDFSRLAKKRGWTVEMLVELFKGKTGIEDRSDGFHEPLANYFERVLTCHWINPETIPYASIIGFYMRELHAGDPGKAKLCICGCGRLAKLGEYALKRCRYRRLKVREGVNG